MRNCLPFWNIGIREFAAYYFLSEKKAGIKQNRFKSCFRLPLNYSPDFE